MSRSRWNLWGINWKYLYILQNIPLYAYFHAVKKKSTPHGRHGKARKRLNRGAAAQGKADKKNITIFQKTAFFAAEFRKKIYIFVVVIMHKERQTAL